MTRARATGEGQPSPVEAFWWTAPTLALRHEGADRKGTCAESKVMTDYIPGTPGLCLAESAKSAKPPTPSLISCNEAGSGFVRHRLEKPPTGLRDPEPTVAERRWSAMPLARPLAFTYGEHGRERGPRGPA
jgi:hypothetical protein